LNTDLIKRIKIPHVFVLLTGVILFCSLLSYILPSGKYQREEKTYGELTRTVVIPGTYEKMAKHTSFKGVVIGDEQEGKASPVSFLGFLTAIPRGMEQAADIIFFIFIIGGAFGILQRTGTITAFLQSLLNLFAGNNVLLTIVIMIIVAIGGSTLGMGEEFIPLIPVFLIVSDRMGYDRIYGLALIMLAGDIGFAAATTNPFTLQIAQGIAEVPLCSGAIFRIIFAACCLGVTLVYVIRYGNRIKKDPTKSFVAGDNVALPEDSFKKQALTASHVWIMISCLIIFALILYAVQEMGWWLNEMSGGFFLMGIVAALISRLSLAETTRAFIKGMEDMVVAALVVGFARGIQVVMVDGQIMDSIIYSVANVLQNFPNIVAAEGMLVFQSVLNFLIPSGSGQAAVTMPLMAPLSDVIGLTRQTAVFAFTCGDGFSNTIIPTSGVLMAMLSLAKIPFEKWLRFMLPLFLQLIFLSALFLAIAVWINY
jgi:uncharacterized ion transporter superfamily protein YfcC